MGGPLEERQHGNDHVGNGYSQRNQLHPGALINDDARPMTTNTELQLDQALRMGTDQKNMAGTSQAVVGGSSA